MSDVNRLVLTGRVGKDPEFKTPGDTELATFSLAVNQWMGEKKGEEAMWININLWGKRAKVAEYIEKGMKLTIEGRLRITSFERDDKDGYVTFVNVDADQVILPDRGDREEGNGGGSSKGKAQKSSRGGSSEEKGRGKKKSRSRKTAF